MLPSLLVVRVEQTLSKIGILSNRLVKVPEVVPTVASVISMLTPDVMTVPCAARRRDAGERKALHVEQAGDATGQPHAALPPHVARDGGSADEWT